MEEINVYTLKEVMDILKITRRSLYNDIKDGKLKAVKIGKYWRVSHETLKDFVASGTEAKN